MELIVELVLQLVLEVFGEVLVKLFGRGARAVVVHRWTRLSIAVAVGALIGFQWPDWVGSERPLIVTVLVVVQALAWLVLSARARRTGEAATTRRWLADMTIVGGAVVAARWISWSVR